MNVNMKLNFQALNVYNCVKPFMNIVLINSLVIIKPGLIKTTHNIC